MTLMTLMTPMTPTMPTLHTSGFHVPSALVNITYIPTGFIIFIDSIKIN
jgi:hypothetical protein